MSSEWSSIVSTLAEDDSSSGAHKTAHKQSEGPQHHAYCSGGSGAGKPALKKCGIDPLELAREIEKLLARFPNFRVNADEQRQLRAALYRPLITIAKEPRTLIVDRIGG
jgi:hypothetical protein